MARKNALAQALAQDETGLDEVGHFNHHFSITMELEQHPLLMAMAAVAVLLVIYLLYKDLFKGGVTGTATQPGTSQPGNIPWLGQTNQSSVPPINITFDGTAGTTGTVTGTGTPTAPTGTPKPPVGVPPTGPAPGPNNNPWQALLGKGPKSVPFGSTITIQGTTYTLGGGAQGRIWGVPGTGWTLSKWNQVPIGASGKRLIYQN